MTGKDVDVGALEETMAEVVETLDLAERAAEFVQTKSPDPQDRARAAAVQKQAEAMLDAAEEAAEEAAGEADDNPPAPSVPDGDRPRGPLH